MAILEFPTIRIDDFSQRPQEVAPELCFLTHMHEDHTVGLARTSYYGPVIYCTAATKSLLLNYRTSSGAGVLKYKHLQKEVCGKEIVRVLELDRPYQMQCSGRPVQITLINANHCPGAAMVLIQPVSSEGVSVLFTGDARCEKWHLDSLRYNPALFPFLRCLGGTKQIAIYADNTFEKHANPFKEYPENFVGLDHLMKMLELYPSKVHFCLADHVTGYEEVLIAVAQKSNTLVHMDAYWYGIYQAAAETSPVAARLLEVSTLELSHSEKTVRLHFCLKNPCCPLREPNSPMAYFKPCNQPSQELVDRQNSCFHKLSVPQCVMTPIDGSSEVFKGPDQRYFFDTESEKYFPLFPWFYYSRHSSFPEIERLCQMFNSTAVRALSGDPIFCKTSHDCHIDRSNYHVADNIQGSSRRINNLANTNVQNRDTLPLVRKKRITQIPLHLDRMRREKVVKYRQKRFYAKANSSEDSSSTGSEDEDERHNAMMLLGRQNIKHKKADKWKRSFLEAERLLSSKYGSNDAILAPEVSDLQSTNNRLQNNIVDTIARNDAGIIIKGISDPDECGESSLPSPPCTPEPTFTRSHHGELDDLAFPDKSKSQYSKLSISNARENNYHEYQRLQPLIRNLIENPGLWLDLRTTFRYRSQLKASQ